MSETNKKHSFSSSVNNHSVKDLKDKRDNTTSSTLVGKSAKKEFRKPV